MEDALFFNFNPNSNSNDDRGVNTANVWYSISLAGNTNADNNGSGFDSTGFTQLGSTMTFTKVADGNINQDTPDVIDFGGVTARYVAIEILTDHGESDGGFVGIGEVQFFEARPFFMPGPFHSQN